MLNGKVAWITGAGTGIGLAAAGEMSARGAMVVMSGRRPEVLEREAAALRQNGGTVETMPFDVADAATVQRTVEAIAKRHGTVDILVNNAGINTKQRHWSDQTAGGWDDVIRINLSGAFYCTQAVLPLMRARKNGLVITVSSWAGVYTSALVGPAYNCSKHALVSMSENINMEECVNGIRSCVICPAEVDTPILAQRPVPPSQEDRARMLKPEDLGAAIAWVAEQPPHVCINEIIISPTWNQFYTRNVVR